MSAVVVVEGVMEGIQLLDNLISAAATISSAVQKAQSTGTPLDMGAILSDESSAENAVLAAIAAAKAAGK